MTKACVVVTSWDDGHKLDNKLAKILESYGLKGTFYIPMRNRGLGPNMGMSDSDVISLSSHFEIGAHGVTHQSLTAMSLSQARKEIAESKIRLSQLISVEVKSFCFPNGEYNSKVVGLVRESGYSNSRTTHSLNFSFDDFRKAGPYNIGCTIQARQAEQVSLEKARKWKEIVRDPVLFRAILENPRWDLFGKILFDKVCREGGVFHLWGHSWEIDINKDWDKLENLLTHIANRKEATYMCVSEFADWFFGHENMEGVGTELGSTQGTES